MKITKIMAFVLLFCMLSSLLLSCNQGSADQSNENTTETSATTKKTQSTTKKPTSSVNYDKELPKTPANLPLYNGKDFNFKDFSLGQSSVMHISIETNKEEYNKYLEDLKNAGYDFYTNNTIGENLYATYTSDTHILNVMYIDAFKQTRVICDERSKFSLPRLESENVYEKTAEPSLTLLSDDAVGWPGRMGYIYKLSDGSFFIIDGGYLKENWNKISSAKYIMSVLEKYADDPDNITVAAWLITHTHSDHLGGFIDMAFDASIRNRVKIETVIHNTPSEYMLSKQDIGEKGTSTMPQWGDKLETALLVWKPDSVIKAHPGQVHHIRDIKLTVYHSQDLVLGSPITTSTPQLIYHSVKTHNDTSIVSMVEFMGKKTLYLADCHALANRNVLDPVYNTSLQADIVQVAHHGYGDTAADTVYQHITPSIVFWPVCKQHYDGLNHDGSIYYENNSAYNGVMNVGFNQEHLFKEGIIHYYHGGDCITFSNFETWEGVRWDAIPD